MALASYLQNYSRHAARPPRVTRSVRQPTTRAPRATAPRATGQTTQPTTNAAGRVVAPGSPLPKPPAAAAAAAPAVAAPLPPLTPAAAAPAGLPVDPTYEGTLAALARNRDTTLAALAARRTQNLQEYGFNASYDPAGNPTAVQFDPSNAFSRAALLRKHYQESKQGTTTGMAAGGQLYSGALLNAQAANDSSFNENENSLERALIAFLASNQGQINQARSAYETGAAQAMADRIARAQQDLINNPPVVPDAADPAANPVAALAAAAVPSAAGAPRPAGLGSSWISGAQNLPKMKIVNGKYYRMGASGKWIPI